jgi:outer membrane lipase/esterase
VITTGFTGAILGRLDAIHQHRTAWDVFAASGGDGLMGLGLGGKSRPRQAGPVSGLSAYSAGTFLGGTRSGSSDLAGFDYDGTSGTAGLEYSVNRNLIVGVAGNYTSANADIDTGATVDVGSVQAAAYLSYATKQWFADALAAIGHHELDLARPGVTADTIRSNTDATTIALAARGAYLFDFGTLRAGPIAGLTYIHTRVGGYTETGDPALTFNMPAQTLDTLTGSVGIRFLAPFMSGGNIVAPFLNVTLEH